ncbi:MAG: hypothetical protein AB8E82_18465 [Aureispira sp.]
MYYYNEELEHAYKNLSQQELLEAMPKGVAVRTPQKGILEVEIPCFRLLPFVVAVAPVLFSVYLLYAGFMLLYTGYDMLSVVFGMVLWGLASWLLVQKALEVVAYGWGKMRIQLSAKGVATPLYIGERIWRAGIQWDWNTIEKITIEESVERRADKEREIRLYQEGGDMAYLYDYYNQKQLFYVLAWLQLYHHYYKGIATAARADWVDLSDHLLDEE